MILTLKRNVTLESRQNDVSTFNHTKMSVDHTKKVSANDATVVTTDAAGEPASGVMPDKDVWEMFGHHLTLGLSQSEAAQAVMSFFVTSA